MTFARPIGVPALASTNDTLAAMAKAGAPHGLALRADTQRAGRGRQGRSWHSPQGGLYLSLLVRKKASPPLPLLVAVAAARVLQAYSREKIWCKWPNDLLIDNKKLAGILIDVIQTGENTATIIGIGINVHNPQPEIAALSQYTDVPIDLNALQDHLSAELLHIAHHPDLSVMKDYRARAAYLGRFVHLDTHTGMFFDIRDDGPLLLRRQNGDLTAHHSGTLRCTSQKIEKSTTDKENTPALLRWLTQVAVPFWSQEGFDSKTGLFFEAVRLDTLAPITDLPRRSRVQARQVYALAHMSFLSQIPQWGEQALRAFATIQKICWQDSAWIHTVNAEGKPQDRRADTYDHCFFLLALAWLYRLEPSKTITHAIDDTVRVFDTVLRAPRGFYDDNQQTTQRSQNPHMHYVEAMLALYEATGNHRWLERAMDATKLVLSTCHDGKLAELFDEDWQTKETPIYEPGHHFEWAWLIHRIFLCSGDKTFLSLAISLTDFARQAGFVTYKDHEIVLDAVGGKTARLWVQTEYLRWCALDADPQDLDTLWGHQDLFLRTDWPGWIDRIDTRGQPLAKNVPASSLYHLITAAAQLIACHYQGTS
ncbi:MAG: biotin--[acetyl-CoA-carboxylase] ligase [Pseudomonadota bacterium]